MSEYPSQKTHRDPGSPRRILGVDMARGIALLTMMITHIFALTDPSTGEPTWAAVFSGRASALFAVLSGISLVLATRSHSDDTDPTVRPSLRTFAPGILIRALTIIIIGLCLGTISRYIAVILVNYGVMFAIALLFLRLRARTLLLLGVVWMLLSPVVSMLIREHFGLEPAYLPMSFFDIAHPGTMLTDLFLTGYYPVLQWLSYVLIGMSLARFGLHDRLRVLLAVGVVLLVIGEGISWLLLGPLGGMEVLHALSEGSGTDLSAALYTGSHGITGTDSWWWLAIAGPHSGTPFDLLSTAGSAVVTIALCQALVVRLDSHSWLVAPLTAPGSLPLSVYSAHIVLLEITHPLIGENPSYGELPEYLLHAIGLAGVALLWKSAVTSRGPLESGISGLVRSVSPPRD